jgi:hypothetical protein
MSREIGLWRVDEKPVRVAPAKLSLESKLEHLIEADPKILGEQVMVIGRQVPTAHGKFIDLLAVDSDGTLHVLELKRDKTPREVVAQALDYGSWIQTLAHDDVLAIFERYRNGKAFETAFTETFGGPPPVELNEGHTLTVVASNVDAATERIVEYLIDFGVPINVMFFRYFEDDGHAYLARTWLVDDERAPASSSKARRTREPWNGQDWYVSFGEDSKIRSWEDARRYGFVSAGGGRWYTRTIRNLLSPGARVFANIPSKGYVGVGEVTGDAMPFPEAVLTVDGVETPMNDLDLHAAYHHGSSELDELEWVVPVQWHSTRAVNDAVWEAGMFANQNSVCKLRNRFTLERLYEAFGVTEA